MNFREAIENWRTYFQLLSNTVKYIDYVSKSLFKASLVKKKHSGNKASRGVRPNFLSTFQA